MYSVDSVCRNHRSSVCTQNTANLVGVFFNSSFLRQLFFPTIFAVFYSFVCFLQMGFAIIIIVVINIIPPFPSRVNLFSSQRERKIYFPLFSWDYFIFDQNHLSLRLLENIFSFICFLCIFSWIRSGGGNWMGSENCFSVTACFRWQFITPAWKETLFLTTLFGLWFHFVVLLKGMSVFANFMKHWPYFGWFLYPWHMRFIVIWTASTPKM